MAGTSSNCVICGEIIAVEAKPLVFEGKEFGVVIDLDAQWEAEKAHYAEKHPEAEVPERWL